MEGAAAAIGGVGGGEPAIEGRRRSQGRGLCVGRVPTVPRSELRSVEGEGLRDAASALIGVRVSFANERGDLAVQIGSSRATLNGAGIEVQPAPVLKNGRILAPLDLVGKALSVTFMLDAESQPITI